MLTAHDLAERFQCHVKTLYLWRRKGILPEPITIGRNLRWREEDIAMFEDFLARRAACRLVGNDPDAADGPAPPVYTTGCYVRDGRQLKAKQREEAREAGRRERAEQRKGIEAAQ